MLFIGMTLMGYFSYRYLPMELYPNAELPMLNVTINSENELDPNYIKNKAIIPVEGVISSLAGVEEIESRISAGNAQIQISFSQNTDTKFAFLQLEEKLKSLKKSLPEEFTLTVSKNGSGSINSQFMTLQILGDSDIDVVRNIADKEIVPILENIDGISSIMLIGGREKSIEVLFDKEKCDALKITPGRITTLITRNMSEKSFAGSVYEVNKRYFVNVEAEYLATSDLGNIVVAPGPIQLKDIADIHFGVKETESLSRVNGKEVVVGLVAKSPQANVIELSDKVRKEISRLNEELASKGITVIVDNDVAEVMNENIDTIINLGVTGAILAIFILYLFLRNFRIVSFIAFAIPISIFTAFFVFYLADISINLLTLTGIALAVGMLLDNSVVVMENIFRLRSTGLDNEQASLQGTREVRKSIVASTLTTITVFLPFLFSDDYLLKLIGAHVGVSIIATLFISLVVALLLIPMAVNRFMKHKGNDINFNKVNLHGCGVQFYLALLKMALRRPMQLIVTVLLLLVMVLVLSFTLTLNTLKEVEADTFNLYLTFPQGNTLLATDAQIRQLEEKLENVAELEQFSTKIYPTDVNLTLKLKENYKRINGKELATLKNELINLAQEIQVSDVSLEALESSDNFRGSNGGNAMMGGSSDLLRKMGMGSQSESIVIKGQDFEVMMNYAYLLSYRLEELENITYSHVSAAQRKPEAQLVFDQYEMEVNNISLLDITSELASFRPQNATSIKYKTNNEEYDITVKDKLLYNKQQQNKNYEEPKRTLDDLRALQVNNSNNAPVELRKFTSINLHSGTGSIHRINQDNQITIRYRFQDDINKSKQLLENARLEVDDLVNNSDIPSSLAVEVIHEEQETDEFTFLILATFALIFMILASVFESITAPIVLMFAIPLAAIGSLFALLLTGNALMNANVLIGFIILIGIVVNNSIILIDYTTLLRRAGNRKVRALMTAGLSRIRPILITAITTIVAMFPLAMGQGEFVSGLGAPFAITVVGGLITSTLLTLIIIPTLYSGLEDALTRLRTQDVRLKIIQLSLFIGSITLIWLLEDGIWWRLGYLILAILLIPGITWFIESSLRQANRTIIPDQDEISIHIRNLVKIYGRPSEFKRELESGNQRRIRLGINLHHNLSDLLWQVPITIFLIYFSFIYLESPFWGILFAVFTWFIVLHIIYLTASFALTRQWNRTAHLLKQTENIVRYGIPLLILYWATAKFDNTGLITLLGLGWYFFIILRIAVEQSQTNEAEQTATTRLSRLRSNLVHIAHQLPLIGPPSVPFRALNAINLDIKTGMFGLLGPNGAGKTTLMRIICGIFEQSYGKIFINGIDSQKKREELQGIIGYLPQEFGTYENLTSWEFLEYQALLKGIYNKTIREKRIYEVLNAVHMWDRKDDKISGFSGGMKQRIGIAQTLLNLPRILVVDEPTAGLDPRERIRFRNLLVELSRNRIVIFSTHIIEDIASSCNQVGVINKGEVKYHGTPTEMVDIAREVTWSFEISAEKFAKLPTDLLIVHHIRQDDRIRVRCLSESQPTLDAIKVLPMLEDSYLWLLRGVKLANNEKIITQ